MVSYFQGGNASLTIGPRRDITASGRSAKAADRAAASVSPPLKTCAVRGLVVSRDLQRFISSPNTAGRGKDEAGDDTLSFGFERVSSGSLSGLRA